MKKQILSLVLVAAMIGTVAAGCSSEKKAGDGSDTTKMDSTSQSAPAATDTTKADTTKKDTTKKM